jgi:hypothetical protein
VAVSVHDATHKRGIKHHFPGRNSAPRSGCADNDSYKRLLLVRTRVVEVPIAADADGFDLIYPPLRT